MRIWIMALLVFGTAATGLAKLIDDVGRPARTFDESGVKISVFPEVRVSAPGLPPGTSKLFLNGAGLRKKKVALFNFNVYVLSSYTDHAMKSPSDAPIDGFAKSKVNALQLTFLRDLSGEQVRQGFVESLSHNGADPKSPALSSLLNKLDMPMPKGSTLTLLGFRKGASEGLVFEAPNGKTVTTEGPGVATTFWKIWYGEPADSGLQNLKNELLGKT